MFGIVLYTAKKTLNDYPRLNLNPFADLDSKFINNEFADVDSNHYNFLCSQACSYYDTAQLNNLLPVDISSNLQSIIHFNARSISANLDMLYSNLVMLKHKFSVIAVTETWTDSNSEQTINIPGYNNLIKSRDANIASRGGGVALFFSSDLAVDVKLRPDISCPADVMECIFVQISHKHLSTKDIIVGVVYRRPGTNISVFNEHFGAVLNKINNENRPSYILGDFNIDLLNSSECNQAFLNTLLSNSFYPSISRPTRIRNDKCATLIDNIFINIHNNLTSSGIWLADITDHLPVFITLPFFISIHCNHGKSFL